MTTTAVTPVTGETPIYDEVLRDTRIDPTAPWINKVAAPTKRDRHKAGRLTQQVWNAIDVNEVRTEDGTVVRVDATIGEVGWE